ncbi:type IV secretion system protein VirB4 [Pseudoduganella lurida]|uniref:Type IV secretion system protein VirB4 n=1 Tax=Pseudoduganella lurida TaxID=1036180 RepID=A0A562R2F3_9BURK|nr:VirB4 family type IV secretion/conjugal transfer ATPase [Pseudoduganella lurida]TWI62556.1 type IV secretion system protein VirB4 [Pseudoduganella lurida]
MIEPITFGVSALGTAMLAMLFGRVRAVDTTGRLAKHRSGEPALADLLVYAAMVDDGIIVGKNGSFIAAWLYEGEDNASSTDTQRENISFRINQALSSLGSGWMVHVDAVRRPAPGYMEPARSYFPDPVSAAIDEERRRLFERIGTMYEGYFVLSLTYFPPLLAQSRFVELMFDDETPSPDRHVRTRGLIDTFRRDCASFESRLSASIRMTRLAGQEFQNEDGTTCTYDALLGWLQYCITGIHQPVQLPANPMYLDAVLGGQEVFGGVVPKIGRKFVQVVAVEGFPLESTPGMLTALGELGCEYRWSSRFIFMDADEAANHLDKFRKKWKQKIRGFFDQVFNTHVTSVNQDAVAMVADAEAAIAEVNSNLVAEGFYTNVVVLMHENREHLEAEARKIEKAIHRLGFATRIETINTMDAFLGSLPGHAVENVRRPLINTMNLADLLPTSTIWTGDAVAPCPMYPPAAPPLMHCVTHGSTPFRFNLHVRDLGHTFMFGPTRAGKSTHLALILAQLRRYPGMTIYAFDYGMALYPVTKAMGGRHFRLAGDDDRLAFCPLQFLASKTDRAWAMEWIDTILALNDVHTTAAQRNEIGNAIMNMHASGARTMSEFSLTIQDEQIREALRQYTVDGAMGHLLDAEEDGLSLSEFTTFEIEDLMSLGDKYALPVLLYLFRRIQRGLHGQPAGIIIDEGWISLGHPAFRTRLRVWLKTLAKANCLVLLSTQNMSDASNSGIFDVILESTATKIFLPNVYARDEDATALYRRMGLNDRQIEIIATATPKRQYYLVSESGRRLYDLALGPLTLAFAGATDKDSIAQIQALEAKHGNDWIHAWLALRGLSLDHFGAAS